MIAAFKPRLEILPSAQQRLWPQLKPTADLGFVLYGGTAIALRLGHRLSVDFDFFSERPLDRQAIAAALPFMAGSTVLQDELNTLSLIIPCDDSEHSHVKLSFFGRIAFGRVADPELTDDGILQVASLQDLLATKVKVILQRAELRDYRDIAAMLRAGANLPHALAAAREIFGPNFQPSESLKALVYFEDGELRTLAHGDKEALIKAASAVRDLPPVALLSRTLIA
jgi:hypothetical protein